MALVISPAVSSPPALPSLSCPSLQWTRQPYYCCSAARRKRSSSRSTTFQMQEFSERSQAALENQKASSSSRRRFLALLLSSSGIPTLSQLITFENNGAAAATDRSIIGPSSGCLLEGLQKTSIPVSLGFVVDGANELQDKKTTDEPIIGDLFGFDGLGKTPEEYVLGKVVALAQAGDGAVLFLGVDGFELPLQLVVGPAEAMAVLTAVQERKSRRPMTHEAWGLSLAAVGWKVDRVVITGNEKDVFYSSVVLSNLSQLLSNSFGVKKSVDMRPSDGIALALRCRAPLFIRKKIAEEILSRKEELSGKTQIDPLKQPGLQANGEALVFIENLVSSLAERKPDCTVYSSWMRRLQSL